MTRDMRKALFTSHVYTGSDKKFAEDPEEYSANIAYQMEDAGNSLLNKCYTAARKKTANGKGPDRQKIEESRKWNLNVKKGEDTGLAESNLFIKKTGVLTESYLDLC